MALPTTGGPRLLNHPVILSSRPGQRPPGPASWQSCWPLRGTPTSTCGCHRTPAPYPLPPRPGLELCWSAYCPALAPQPLDTTGHARAWLRQAQPARAGLWLPCQDSGRAGWGQQLGAPHSLVPPLLSLAEVDSLPTHRPPGPPRGAPTLQRVAQGPGIPPRFPHRCKEGTELPCALSPAQDWPGAAAGAQQHQTAKEPRPWGREQGRCGISRRPDPSPRPPERRTGPWKAGSRRAASIYLGIRPGSAADVAGDRAGSQDERDADVMAMEGAVESGRGGGASAGGRGVVGAGPWSKAGLGGVVGAGPRRRLGRDRRCGGRGAGIGVEAGPALGAGPAVAWRVGGGEARRGLGRREAKPLRSLDARRSRRPGSRRPRGCPSRWWRRCGR